MSVENKKLKQHTHIHEQIYKKKQVVRSGRLFVIMANHFNRKETTFSFFFQPVMPGTPRISQDILLLLSISSSSSSSAWSEFRCVISFSFFSYFIFSIIFFLLLHFGCWSVGRSVDLLVHFGLREKNVWECVCVWEKSKPSDEKWEREIFLFFFSLVVFTMYGMFMSGYSSFRWWNEWKTLSKREKNMFGHIHKIYFTHSLYDIQNGKVKLKLKLLIFSEKNHHHHFPSFHHHKKINNEKKRVWILNGWKWMKRKKDFN